MPPNPPRWGFVVGLLLIHVGTVVGTCHPHTFLKADAINYAYMAVSMIQDGDLDLRNNLPLPPSRNPESSFYALGRDGAWYPKHPPLLGFLGIPFYFLLGFSGLLLLNGLWVGGAIVILSLFLPKQISWLHGLAFSAVFVQPYLFAHVYDFSSDMLLAFLLAGSAWLLFSHREGWAGFLAGMMVFVRPNYLLQCLVGAWFAPRRSRFLAGAAAGLLPCLLYNTWAFGAPWKTGYQSVILQTATGYAVVSHLSLFHLSPRQWLDLWITFPRGLLFSAPLLLPFLLAPWLRSRTVDAIHRFQTITFLWHYVFYAFYIPWDADRGGIRFMIPVIFFSCLGSRYCVGDPTPEVSPRNDDPPS